MIAMWHALLYLIEFQRKFVQYASGVENKKKQWPNNECPYSEMFAWLCVCVCNAKQRTIWFIEMKINWWIDACGAYIYAFIDDGSVDWLPIAISESVLMYYYFDSIAFECGMVRFKKNTLSTSTAAASSSSSAKLMSLTDIVRTD